MSNRQDYVTAIGNLVNGELPLGETEKIMAVGLAIKVHSKHKPRKIAEDVTGDGGFDYAVSDLAAWADEFSSVKRIEYPADDDDATPAVLQPGDWSIYESPDGDVIRFVNDTPETTEAFRVFYTALHTCTDTACTVAGFDEEAVQQLSAAFFCDMLAAAYAQSQDSTIAADSVDHRGKSGEYAGRANAYRKAYFLHMGIKEGQTQAASVTMDQDTLGSWGTDKMTHPQRYR